jgi:succinate dehydrogenase/fumarate reductase flavoprotein subunit
MSRRYEIVIIGAGLAGLAAARMSMGIEPALVSAWKPQYFLKGLQA